MLDVIIINKWSYSVPSRPVPSRPGSARFRSVSFYSALLCSIHRRAGLQLVAPHTVRAAVPVDGRRQRERAAGRTRLGDEQLRARHRPRRRVVVHIDDVQRQLDDLEVGDRLDGHVDGEDARRRPRTDLVAVDRRRCRDVARRGVDLYEVRRRRRLCEERVAKPTQHVGVVATREARVSHDVTHKRARRKLLQQAVLERQLAAAECH